MKNLLLLIVVGMTVATNVQADEQIGKLLLECRNKNRFFYTHHVRHETDPHKFYKCLGSYGFLMECQMDGNERTVFYPQIQRCYKKQNNPWDEEPDCKTDNRKKPHKDCHRYYECIDGVAYERSCLQGHYFNPILGQCDIGECKRPKF